MGGKGSGRPKEPKQLAKEAVGREDVDKLFQRLHEWAEGKPVICPHCFKDTGARTADTIALQSTLELLNRILGKVPQQVQLDITEKIQLTADQVDLLIERYRIASQAQLGPVIEGEIVSHS